MLTRSMNIFNFKKYVFQVKKEKKTSFHLFQVPVAANTAKRLSCSALLTFLVLGQLYCHSRVPNKNGIYMYCSSGSGPSFGAGYDLYIANRVNVNSESYSNLGNSYECPPDTNCETFLAGQKYFVVTELEVFVFFYGFKKCKAEWFCYANCLKIL